MKKISIILLIVLLFTNASLANVQGTNIYKEGILEGYFIEAIDNKIKVEEYGGTIYTIPMIKNVVLQIDGRPVKTSDFKRGMEVYIELQGRSIKYMDAYSVDNPAYIQPGEKVRVGTVLKIDRDQLEIQLPTGKREVYFTSPATVVLRNKENTNLSQLYVGDRVKLFFDEIDTSYISRISIQGDSILIKDIYKGQLTVSDSLQDIIALEKAEVFRNGRWMSLGKNIKVPYDGNLPIYIGGQKIDTKNLKHYKGKTVYMAMKDYFGKEKAERMVVKAQYENNFSEKIKEINWFSSQLELGNNRNINFHDGTIVVKNNRLVDVYNLNSGSDGLIIADGRGKDLTADLVYIYNENINNSNIGQDQLYAGRLNTILEDIVYLKDFFLLDKNDWESFNDEKEFFYDDDTFIYDMEKNKEVSPKEFFSWNYSADENNRRNRTRDWYGYLYTDGDRISAAFIKRSMDSLLKQRTTIGIVESNPVEDNNMGWFLKLRDGKDWSTINDQWMEKNSTLNIYLREAMIIKNGQRITVNDVKAGDRLYMVRDDNMAKVIIIK
ncbi:hypothetical protein RBU61_15600 [Tissierella sp. MB52-C2]|uniref:hypothetical protein n=1 Tax=Tissierella sp. MB52-C2 TaxID=3070999 RepID=UPI00280B0B3C|nr:hypothetical protein [Tissierella sp. MB52-C2]WMM24338.1 hypothetical protein RBU61_15600 [Tissierella sp. MB52-C2]